MVVTDVFLVNDVVQTGAYRVLLRWLVFKALVELFPIVHLEPYPQAADEETFWTYSLDLGYAYLV